MQHGSWLIRTHANWLVGYDQPAHTYVDCHQRSVPVVALVVEVVLSLPQPRHPRLGDQRRGRISPSSLVPLSFLFNPTVGCYPTMGFKHWLLLSVLPAGLLSLLSCKLSGGFGSGALGTSRCCSHPEGIECTSQPLSVLLIW